MFRLIEKFYTVKEVSEALKIPQISVTRLIRNGTIKGIKLGGQWRISEKNFNLFIEESEKESMTTTQKSP